MSNNLPASVNINPSGEWDRWKLLARVYGFILSWPDPHELETAGSNNCREEREPAEKDAHAEERAAS